MKTENNFSQIKGLIVPFILFSCITNLAILVSPIYMMQVLDRVVPSGNMATLYLLLAVSLGIILLHGVVEYFRDISLKRLSIWIEKHGMMFALLYEGDKRQDTIDHVARLKQFFRSSQASTAINLPWIPLFLIALSLISPFFLLLVAGVIGVGFLLKKTSEWSTLNSDISAAQLSKQENLTLKDAADPVLKAGMRAVSENLMTRFHSIQKTRQDQESASFSMSTVETAGSSTIRMSSQILALSLGAALVVTGDLTAGGMIGASIITSKTIQIIEGSLGSMAPMKSAFHSFKFLSGLSEPNNSLQPEVSELSGRIKCTDLIYPRGGGAPPRLDRISFELKPSQCLAIIGDSGSGKTTLLNALCGIDPCPIGSVFYDETEIQTLGSLTLQKNIGYLPQQARLTKGSLAENISCFQVNPNDDEIIRAARVAGVHGLISSLPDSYTTDIGEHPYLLSAGQKQRVALARSIYSHPKYLFLDEPNALLDANGERQLCDTLSVLKKQGTSIVMVLHRSGLMGLADKVLLLEHGRIADFGARAEVLGRMNDSRQKIEIKLISASVQDLNDWVLAQFQRHNDKEFAQKTILAATELFNSARLNGKSDIKREATITLKFLDEHHCEIILMETGETPAAQKMGKIKSLISHPEVNMLDLPEDEISLAVLAQITDELSIENIRNTAVYKTILSSDQFQAATEVRH